MLWGPSHMPEPDRTVCARAAALIPPCLRAQTAKIADVGLSRVIQATLATVTQDAHFMRGCVLPKRNVFAHLLTGLRTACVITMLMHGAS